MAIKHRKKNGHVYLEEYKSIRINGKVKSIYVRSLGPENPVLKPNKVKPTVLDRLEHSSSHRAGDVALLLEIAHQQNFTNIIDGICCGETGIEGPSPGKMLTAWAINRVIDPMSATSLERWVPTTDLPRLMGINPADFTKRAFLSALDFVCYEDKKNGRIQDFTPKINDALYRRWRELHPLQFGERETLAYDITSILFFGVQCPLAELGRNSKGIKQLQANLALIVSRKEKYPLTHFVYEGSRNDVSTIKNLLYRLQESSLESGTLIWDRGNVSNELVNEAEKANWNLICGIPKSSNESRDIIRGTNIPYSWDSLIRSSKKGHIYATKVLRKLYGKERSLTVYANRERELHDSDTRNETLLSIEEALQSLANIDPSISEKEIREKAKKIIGGYSEFIEFSVSRKRDTPRVKWRVKRKEVREAEKLDGKYILLSTDASLSAKEVVNAYVEKDFIEKVFCILKTCEEMEPVRHRLENRVRAYLFVCVLAYRLLAALQHNLQLISDKDNSNWESANSFLVRLGRVERVNVRLGQQVKTWYLNITRKDQQTLKKLGFKDLLKETIEVNFRV
jgi:transposase